MTRYQRKSIPVEAAVYDGTLESVAEIVRDTAHHFTDTMEMGPEYPSIPLLTVQGLRGAVMVEPGQWLIHDRGTFIVKDAHTFERNYEEAP